LDCPLNDEGRRQAAKLAPLLAGFAPQRLFTSDLSRSIETARPAAAMLGITPCVSPLFREYSWGELEGLSWPEIKERFPALFSRLRYDLRGADIPGQEPVNDFRRRLQEGLSLLLEDKQAHTVALVGHGRYLNALTVEFLGLAFDGPWPFSFSSAAVTVLEDKGGRRRLLRFNDQCHLTGDEYA
jgi:probable phosphoglycerate mutase